MMKTGVIMRNRLKSNKGFTLIEVIAVLVILAILSAVAISRGMQTDEVQLQTEVDTLIAHLRYAQYLALNDISPTKWGIAIGGSSYALVKDPLGNGAFNSPLSLPGESSATHSISPFTATSTNVLFDEWGSPGTAGINVTLGGKTITITANTGFIP